MNAQSKPPRPDNYFDCDADSAPRPRAFSGPGRRFGTAFGLIGLSLSDARAMDEAFLRLRFADMLEALLPDAVREMILAGRDPRKMSKSEILDFMAANASWLNPS